MPRLRWIHSMGAGVEDIVSDEIRRRDILLTNVGDAYAPAMAEYAFAAMVMLARDFSLLVEAYASREWLDVRRGSLLRGHRVGIIGYGAVGRNLATLCKAAGMEVWAMRRRVVDHEAKPADRLLAVDDLPLLLGNSDYVVVAASSNSTTQGLLGKREFFQMKHSACIINVARGALVDHDALVDALRAGRLRGAVLDVVTPEPLPHDSALWDVQNLWITPHLSANTDESWKRAIDNFCSNVDLFLSGRESEMRDVLDIEMML